MVISVYYYIFIGLARFATEKYSLNSASLAKRFVHLTNYSVNKFSENYVENNFDEIVKTAVITIGY